MKKLHLEIHINATQEKVWETITTLNYYQEWTKEFNPTSTFEGGWNTGDSIRFIGVDEKGEKGGMISEIAESRKPEYISIRHLGYIMNGQEDTTSDAVKAWAPAYENYTIRQEGEGVTFIVDQDLEDSYEEMFKELWPKALQKIKEISERENF